MHVVSDMNMQDDVAETNADDDAHINSNQSQDAKHITVDCSDITTRYQDICPLGCGANALVFSAIDQQSQKRLAVKKVR